MCVEPEKQIAQYFIINDALDQLRVNNQTVPFDSILGPLPDFAIIEFAYFAFFWIGNSSALDFVAKISDQDPVPKVQELVSSTMDQIGLLVSDSST